MESLSILGVAAFCMVVGLMSLPRQVKTLNKKVKRLSKLIEGDKNMSKLLEELVGKKCAIYITGGGLGLAGVIIAVDEDWVKIEVENKKGRNKIKLYPIESIENVEIM